MKLKAEGCTIDLEIVEDIDSDGNRTGIASLVLNGDAIMRVQTAHTFAMYQILRNKLRTRSVSLVESDGGVISNGGHFDNLPVKTSPRTINGKVVGCYLDTEQYALLTAKYAPLPGWREIGTQYGYPACCIDAFVNLEHIKHPGRYKLDGTGYVPCRECNERYSEQEMADRINELRYKCLKPFTTNRMDHIECEEG